MEKILEQTLLFDFYGELLTEHQKAVYEYVVLNDYSLSEAAEEYDISRQGVHDLIKRCNAILAGYEKKLHLVEKFMTAKKMVNEINGLVREFRNSGNVCCIDRIDEISNDMLNIF